MLIGENEQAMRKILDMTRPISLEYELVKFFSFVGRNNCRKGCPNSVVK